MERLTFDGNFCDIAICQEVPCKYPDTGCTQRQVWERLKAYEDIGLSPEDIYEMLTKTYGPMHITVGRGLELAQLEKQGRIFVLPEECVNPSREYLFKGGANSFVEKAGENVVPKEQYDDLRESFVDFATSGINNLAPYCKNRCKGCVNERGWCLHDDCCRGFNPDGRDNNG